MPTPHLRIAVVPTPEQRALLERLGALQGRSQASYLRHLLDVATPSLRRLAAHLDGVEAVQVEVDHNIADAIDTLQAEADEQLDLEYDTMLSAELEAADAGDPKPAPGARAAADPRKVTRGSEPHSGAKKRPKAVSRVVRR